jgi:hypothetical protein
LLRKPVLVNNVLGMVFTLKSAEGSAKRGWETSILDLSASLDTFSVSRAGSNLSQCERSQCTFVGYSEFVSKQHRRNAPSTFEELLPVAFVTISRCYWSLLLKEFFFLNPLLFASCTDTVKLLEA